MSNRMREGRERKESMTHTTTSTSTSNDIAMGNGNKKSTPNSFSADDLPKHSFKFNNNNKDVAKWSSTEVQHWIKQQCKKFALKKATAEKFEMNGEALVLLTKHDFLRRSPDGGEVLYYALQGLINPNKANSSNLDQTSSRNKSSSQNSRIVEISRDNSEFNNATDASSPKPIVEEPDDPPIIRRTQSDAQYNNYQQQRSRPLFFSQAHIHPAIVTMPASAAAAYFHQQQGFPHTFMYAHHHPHLHTQQQHVFHPHLIHQYHPMMSAQGILIEIMDDTEINNHTRDGTNGPINGARESFYRVTANGQRYIMNEGQVRQLVTEVYQRQTYQENLLQQQLLQQQLLQQQQLQQQQQQQQQYFQQQQQQQQQQHFQQQPQQQQQHFQQQSQQPFPEQQRF